MPMDYSRYPDNWDEISKAIRERDWQQCKFCGVHNGANVIRVSGVLQTPRFFEWVVAKKLYRLWTGRWRISADSTATKIVLTVAHLGAPLADGTPGDPHNKMDVRSENLAALCQRCHLMFDLDDHVINSAHTRRAKRIESGQGVLL